MGALAILGASGHGKVVADLALVCGWSSVAFFDDAELSGAGNSRWPVLGSFDLLLADLERFDGVVVAIGDCRVRMQKQQALERAGGNIATLMHPSSVVSRYAVVGRGTVILANGVVNADAVLGSGVIVNTAATVDHDCSLGDGVHVAPGAHLAADVWVGERSWIGIGACVRQGIRVGSDVLVGAGAVVVDNIPDGTRVVGNPARQFAPTRST